jgi:polyisoprenoid-binding protein YceI
MRQRLLRTPLRRVLLLVTILVLLVVLGAALLARQLIFGGTPTLHSGAPGGSQPCSSTPVPAGYTAFGLDAKHSSVAYTVHFQAAGQSLPGTVTGETSAVSGQFLLATASTLAVSSLQLQVDLRTLDSGSSDRDEHIRDDTFDTAQFPFAVFVAQQATILGGSYRQGQSVDFSLPGELTLHGVTRPVTFAMQGKWQANTVTGSGSAVIKLQDFGMQDPQITSAIPITIAKAITLMIQLTAQKEACIHTVPSVAYNHHALLPY